MANARKVYDFTGVGETEEEQSNKFSDPAAGTPVGIVTPLRLSNTNGTFFEMNIDLEKQIIDNFRNMIATDHGERLMLSDFGANLGELAFELGTDEVDGEAMKRISKTTTKYMPFVSLSSFEPTKETSLDGTLARVGVIVTFSVPSVGIGPQSVKAIISAVG